jgi:hypothetical protein
MDTHNMNWFPQLLIRTTNQIYSNRPIDRLVPELKRAHGQNQDVFSLQCVKTILRKE